MLTSVISEVVAGVQKGMITESKTEQRTQPQPQQNEISESERKKALESKNKLLAAIGSSAYNDVDLFEGTTPIKKAGKASSGSGGYTPFDGVDPSDPGVDISALTRAAGKNWKRLTEGNK